MRLRLLLGATAAAAALQPARLPVQPVVAVAPVFAQTRWGAGKIVVN